MDLGRDGHSSTDISPAITELPSNVFLNADPSSPIKAIIKGLASVCDADIQLDNHAPPPLSATRPGRALLALQTLAASGIPAKKLFDLLRSGLIKLRDRPEFDTFENVSPGYVQFLCREARVVGDKDWGKRLSDYSDKCRYQQ